MCVYSLFVMGPACCVVDVVMGGRNFDNIVGVVKDGFLHHAGWGRNMEQSMKRMIWVSRLMSE